MQINPLKRAVLALFFVLSPMVSVLARDLDSTRHLEVSMRMIGHRLLLSSGNKFSRVLPIKRTENTFQISFENTLEVHPDSLVAIVKKVLNHARVFRDYSVELEKCDSKEIVYSFEVAHHQKNNIVPCGGRLQPKDCYTVLITLNSSGETFSMNPAPIRAENVVKYETYSLTPWLILGILILSAVGIFVVYRKRKETDPNTLKLGSFQFDTRNSTLLISDTIIELTGKEAELLLLLLESVNEIVNRDDILNKVWSDDGDYVGRTLDVFISKLRKKLEPDPNVKIVNMRGVGYKLVVNA